jgi:hypothetical protein
VAKYLNIVNAQIAVLDSYEVAIWMASGLLDGDAVIDEDANAIVYYNFDTDDFTYIYLGGGGGAQTYTKQYGKITGTLSDSDLIGLTDVIGVFVDGSIINWVIDGVPDPGVSVNIDTSTGQVDPGYSWEDNNIIVQYTSVNPPTPPLP